MTKIGHPRNYTTLTDVTLLGDWLMDDIKLQREIEQLIADGKVALPNWGWPMLKSYHGFSGVDRVRGWQISTIAERLGLIPKARSARCV